MQRWVLHIDMDAFFASCEQLTRPTLRGKPVLVGGVNGRGVVAGASYEARAFGVHSAMPMHQARALVGYTAVSVAPRKVVYSAVSRKVMRLIEDEVGIIEQLSVDEAFMEPTALVGASVDDVVDWANMLREKIRTTVGIPSSVGAGAGKQYAKIGSGLAKPDGTFAIPREEQDEILGPLPVRSLWGVGPVAEAKLRGLGITTIAEFAALSQKEVEVTLGKAVGVTLWELARGHDDRIVAPRAVAKQVSAEQTYARDLTTVDEVDRAVRHAAEEAHVRLRKDGRGARTVTVKLKMADFHIESRSYTLPYATDEFDTLFAAAMRITRYPSEVGAIRLVGVSFSGLEEALQDVLFPELDQEIVREEVVTEYDAGVDFPEVTVNAEGEAVVSRWRATQDVYHPDYGHGWVQGTGGGIVTVRFETRTTGPGKIHTFAVDDEELQPADPLDSLDWPEDPQVPETGDEELTDE
ncbi:DNA polymerase IV [uncultured Corynebacterium sp.]|uniref:DNA polymerase IV n=1 Tax=uncultured Corynebacterium sp. TaxID=159447 RepID=UPI00262CACCB|nr:DNA polymerase IV [uncultured Corynebacterium sp.]